MRQVVLLGASNLTIGFPLLVETLRARIDGPLHVRTAMGHGRSFGNWSRVLFRSLPGITDCKLWEQLQAAGETAEPPLALITDVGNDILYGASVAEILDWIETCLKRLAERQADVVLTLLPMCSVRRLSRWRYRLTKAMFFPRSDLTYDIMVERAQELNQQLQDLATRHDAGTVEPADGWYGFDPIHIRRSRRMDAWNHILSHWRSVENGTAMKRASLPQQLKLWRLRPAERRFFGRHQAAEQPILESSETRISVY